MTGYYQKDIFGNSISLELLEQIRLDNLFKQGVVCTECGKKVEDRFSLYEFQGKVGHIKCLTGEDQKLVECFTCGRYLLQENAIPVQVYDDPWDEKPNTIYVCPDDWGPIFISDFPHRREDSCFDLLFDTSWADFRYFTCNKCERVVIRQCPYNGWHSYVRITDKGEICLKCYEEDILEHGIPREKFARGEIPGMFFSRDNKEVIDAGYKEVKRYVFIRSEESVKNFCKEAMKLIDLGCKVVVAYESMAISGLEGTVSLYAKK